MNKTNITYNHHHTAAAASKKARAAAKPELERKDLILRFDTLEGHSPAVIQVPLRKLSKAERALLGDHVYGIDVCWLASNPRGTFKAVDQDGVPMRVRAESSTIDSLLAALRRIEKLEAADRQSARESSIYMSLQNFDVVAAGKRGRKKQASNQE